ncbi:MAG: flagellar basal-body rod protein FlgG [Candidatus Sedimenticola sp. (ex Thyasira tokunagai)]
MSDSLYVAATGMHAQQKQLDVIANNLANTNTTAFKKSRIDFGDLMYQASTSVQGNLLSSDINNPIGVGASAAQIGKIFTGGEAKKTERSLDLAIIGEGFFEVILPDGSYGYTRSGAMQSNADGMLTTLDGYPLSAYVHLPTDTEEVVINTNGVVMVKLAGEDGLSEVGNIELVQFLNTRGLNPMGDNMYLPSEKSGSAIYGIPGEEGTGSLAQGFLESSNVQLIEELSNLILAQRTYEINSKVVQASDEAMGIVNNLRR